MAAVFVTALLAQPVAADDNVSARTVTPPPRASHSLARRPIDEASTTAEELLFARLRTIWSGKTLRRGITAVYVVDAKTGEVLFTAHENRGMNPASNVKLVSTATVLSILGPNWRYTTRLLGPSPTPDGQVVGDLYLFGDADPTLGTDALAELANNAATAGVKRINGDIVLSNDDYRDGVARARVLVEVTGTANGSAPTVAMTPSIPYIQLENLANTTTSGRRARIRVGTEQRPTPTDEPSLKVTVRGTIPPGVTKKFWRRVPHRRLFSAYAMRAALVGAGIQVTGGVQLQPLRKYVERAADASYLPVDLAVHRSAPLRRLIARINKPSNNYLADRLLMTAGGHRYAEPPSLEAGVRAMNEWLRSIGIDPESTVLDTGSGLSYASRLSAKQIGRVLLVSAGYLDAALEPSTPAEFAPAGGGITGGGLRGSFMVGLDVGDDSPSLVDEGWVEDDELDAVWRASLAVAGVDGTLRRRYKSSPVRNAMFGKTGTLTSVIALSGVVRLSADNGVVFAIVTNGHAHRRRNRVRFEHRLMTEAMFDYLKLRAIRYSSSP